MHSLAGMRWVSYPWGCSLFHCLLSVTLTLLVWHRGLWSHSFSLAWALRPLLLFLSRGPRAPSFSFSRVGLAPSLSLSLARAGLAPPPPFTRGLCSHIRALHSWCRTTFSWPLSRSWHPPHAQKPLVSVWLEFRYPFVWWALTGFFPSLD